MSRVRRIVVLTSATVLVLVLRPALGIAAPGTAARSEPTASCNAACLDGFVDRFFAAALAHDPGRLETSNDVRYTENGQLLPLGEGLWATLSGMRDYKLYIPDPIAGQVGYMGAVDENGASSLIAARLKVAERKVSEIEVIAARSDRADVPDYREVMAPPGFSSALSQSERVSRDRMIQIANSYFDAIERQSVSAELLADTCERVENGQTMAGNSRADDPLRRLSCREEINAKALQYLSYVSPRRFIAVDEQHGTIFTLPMIVSTGAVPKTLKLADGTSFEPPDFARRPTTMLTAISFKIVSGRIEHIEAIQTAIPYGSKHGWEAN